MGKKEGEAMIFQILGLLVMLVFYGCYLGKMLRQRRQGIRTDQMGRGKRGRVLAIELTMKAASLLVPLAEFISIVRNTAALPAGVRWLGLALAVLGDIAFVLSVVTMKDSWRAGVPESDKTDLVTTGIYRYSRNPAFLGFDLVYIGLLLAFFNIALLVLSLFAVVMFHLQIVYVEEPFLVKAFGTEYQAYSQAVRRYFGRK